LGHILNAKDELYHALAERLSKTPEGAPINEPLLQILHRLYTESEALVGSQLPLVPMSLEKIAILMDFPEEKLRTLLDGMSDKGLVIDIPRKNTVYYMLTPMVVGFFEYTFMRTGKQVDLKELAELFDIYFHSEGVRAEMAGLDTKIMRTLVYENVIPLAVETEVLNYERATKIIKEAGGGAISLCACRHEAAHMGTACDAPVEVCTSLGSAAEWIIRKGLGRPATVEELLNVLEQTQELGLVHLCDNVMNKPTYICHCCGCCCKVLSGINEDQIFATQPSHFIPTLDSENCLGCGICSDKCQIHAITLTHLGEGEEMPVVKEELCLGCGVCSAACPSGALTMFRRTVLSIPPENIQEKTRRMHQEKGRA